MTRLGFVAPAVIALTACTGLPPSVHPLFIARSDSVAADAAAPRVAVEMNNVLLVLPASTAAGCSITGDYVRQGSSVEVQLRHGPGTAACDGPARPFVTRLGPFPPGEYEVTVMLDGNQLIRAERAVIS